MKKAKLFQAASTAFFSLLAFSASLDARAKYEPADGSIYYGYCASGYWSDAEFKSTLDGIYNDVSDKPFLLYSMFVHAMENGRWNGWEYRKDGPNGKPIHGAGQEVLKVRDAGFTPVVAWTWMDWSHHATSPSLKGVIRGDYDWYIDEWIAGMKEFADPIFIRLSHEMDGGWYPYSEGYTGGPELVTAEDYIAYWKYVVDRFRAAGVENVAWVWNVAGSRQGARDWVDYYPGDEYVDWIAVDVYSNKNGGDTLRAFREAMGDHKPIMIPEGGTEDLLTAYHVNYPGNTAWIKEFYDTILNDMGNRVKAVMWFQWDRYSFLQRDPSQIPTYRSYVERPEFISELYTGGETQLPDVPDAEASGIYVQDSAQVALNGSLTLDAQFYGFAGQIGSRWDVESGSATGLKIEAKGSSAVLTGVSAGDYKVKIQAWDKETHRSAYVTVNVAGGTGSLPADENQSEPTAPAPGSLIPARLEITANEPGKTVYADLSKFTGKIGGNWSQVKGEAGGLVISDNLSAATIQSSRPGKYVVKGQFWDKDSFDSGYLEVEVAPYEDSATATAEIIAPDWVEIEADGTEFTLATRYSGFTPTGGRWSIERGDATGLKINGKGETVTLQATKVGEYVVKTQAWSATTHVSKHIRVTVVPTK